MTSPHTPTPRHASYLAEQFRPSEISAERAEQLMAWQREDARIRRRTYVRRILAMFASCLCGLLVMAQAFRVTDRALGEALLSAGVAVGWIGVVGVLVHAWVREQGE